MINTTRLSVVWSMSLLALVVFAILTLIPGSTLITDGLIALIAAVATGFVVFCYRQFEKTEKPGRVWFHFALGVGLWTLGEVLWLVYSMFTDEVPLPSMGDVAWLSGYIFLTTSLLIQYRLIWGIHPRQERQILLLIGSAILVGSALIAYGTENQDRMAVFINTMYPLADLALALAALKLAHTFGTGQWGRPWQALLVFALADAVYAWFIELNVYGENLILTSLADTIYFAAYIVLAVACYHQYLLVKRA